MWRADRKRDDDGASDEIADVGAGGSGGDREQERALHPVRNATEPHTLSLGTADAVAGNIAEPVWRAWRQELAEVGGRSPLLHFTDTARTRIELSTTHPGGLPQFITGKTTLLSSLIRDDLALRSAKLAAAAVTEKGVELRAVRGIDTVHLAIGLAQWRYAEEEFSAPVLMQSVAIRRYGKDFEMKLRGQPFVNPRLGPVLGEQFHISLDAEALVALSITNGSFKPQPVIDRLRGLTSHLAWFTVQPRLLVSSFGDVAAAMAGDAGDLGTPMLDALAGNPAARRLISESHRAVEVVGQDARPPATDTLLLDADEEQEDAIAQIAGGNSVVVRTLPGTGGTQTIVNAIGALVTSGKRVLVVGPRRSSLDAVVQRLTAVGLGGLAISQRTVRRDLIAAITRNEKAAQPRVTDVDDALVRLRKVLLDYRAALHHVDPILGVSVLDALEELARLALVPDPPSTTARLDRASVEALTHDRDRASETLARAAQLGEFKYGPGDSPWYGATFVSSRDADVAHDTAKRVSRFEMPRLLERANAVIAQTRMRPYESIAELGVYLRLVLDIRDTLDRFRPQVFDRSLAELIAATSSRGDGAGMSGANRRRLRKLALEHVRPGVHVTDLNESLRKIQQQRMLWQRFTAEGIPPEVPVGVADVQVAYQRVADDLAKLDVPLGRSGTSNALALVPIDQLLPTLAALAAESEVLANLQERVSTLAELSTLNLDPLLSDLSARHVPDSQIAAELDLAWWQSVLESMLENDKALLGANTGVLDRLEADFRLVDEAHAASAGQRLAWTLSELWKIAVVDWPDEASALRRLLKSGKISAQSLAESAPHVGKAVAPVWIASPYEVPALGDDQEFDVALIVDAGATTVAENVAVIRRAHQVVAFGDPVTETPSPFSIAVTPTAEQERPRGVDVDALHADSVLARFSEILPVFTLTRSYRAGGEDLADLVNRRFYGGRLEALPWAGTFLGSPSLSLTYVAEGHGMPDTDSGAVESPDAEIDAVVDIVLEHAQNRPRESLMVVTASSRHAIRVNQAVLNAFAARADLSDFILGDRPEAFSVVTLEQSVGQSRDRVIFSIGYGRTPHGRLLSSFGALSEPGGDRLLAIAMTRARRALDIVSCFRPEDIDVSRVSGGIVALAQLLTEAEAIQSTPPEDVVSDPMLVDLAHRLESRGLRVALGYRGKLALVATYSGRAVVVETDTDVDRGTLRESLRLRPDLLRRLGWHYLRVHSFELFSDPDAVAMRISNLIEITSDYTETAPLDFELTT